MSISQKGKWYEIEFSNNKELFIILTVPHAECVEYIEHTCDYTALSNAQNLSNILDSHNIKYILLIGDINRQESDLNRKESRKTKFHEELTLLLEEKRINHSVILLDIHSGNFGSQSLVILKSKKFRELELLDLIQNFTNASIHVGSEENYIMEKALSYKIPALLIEFNEVFRYSDGFYQNFVKAIRIWYYNKSK